ncbi:MAG TPA: type III-A CRISPR-associated RAMP protein Csm3 [Bellilinea sp.]|nr:type III-A CRISPR-associated RAMP protein Csm3 [Bellilinea sp.]
MRLYGRLVIQGNILVKTGLHIGGSGGAFAIGGVDNPVIVNQVTGQPYIPGSSLRGKMRSLTEKYLGRTTGQRISQSQIHACKTEAEYLECPICNIFGITAEDFNWPTRLLVRDVALDPDSAMTIREAKTALPYTEIKTEVAIDRVTSQANPRDVERVPAGAVFGPMELVYNIYCEQDVTWLSVVLDAMQLLEDDYLGGHGSRGSGKIAFQDLQLTLKRADQYRQPIDLGHFSTLEDLSTAAEETLAKVWAEFA